MLFSQDRRPARPTLKQFHHSSPQSTSLARPSNLPATSIRSASPNLQRHSRCPSAATSPPQHKGASAPINTTPFPKGGDAPGLAKNGELPGPADWGHDEKPQAARKPEGHYNHVRSASPEWQDINTSQEWSIGEEQAASTPATSHGSHRFDGAAGRGTAGRNSHPTGDQHRKTSNQTSGDAGRASWGRRGPGEGHDFADFGAGSKRLQLSETSSSGEVPLLKPPSKGRCESTGSSVITPLSKALPGASDLHKHDLNMRRYTQAGNAQHREQNQNNIPARSKGRQVSDPLHVRELRRRTERPNSVGAVHGSSGSVRTPLPSKRMNPASVHTRNLRNIDRVNPDSREAAARGRKYDRIPSKQEPPKRHGSQTRAIDMSWQTCTESSNATVIGPRSKGCKARSSRSLDGHEGHKTNSIASQSEQEIQSADVGTEKHKALNNMSSSRKAQEQANAEAVANGTEEIEGHSGCVHHHYHTHHHHYQNYHSHHYGSKTETPFSMGPVDRVLETKADQLSPMSSISNIRRGRSGVRVQRVTRHIIRPKIRYVIKAGRSGWPQSVMVPWSEYWSDWIAQLERRRRRRQREWRRTPSP